MRYDLLDVNTGDRYDRFPTEEAALEFVRGLVALHGPEIAETLSLAGRDAAGRALPPLRGRTLLERARSLEALVGKHAERWPVFAESRLLGEIKAPGGSFETKLNLPADSGLAQTTANRWDGRQSAGKALSPSAPGQRKDPKRRKH